jgi:hypothetical protein
LVGALVVISSWVTKGHLRMQRATANEVVVGMKWDGEGLLYRKHWKGTSLMVIEQQVPIAPIV